MVERGLQEADARDVAQHVVIAVSQATPYPELEAMLVAAEKEEQELSLLSKGSILLPGQESAAVRLHRAIDQIKGHPRSLKSPFRAR
jgi:hypothetical protein